MANISRYLQAIRNAIYGEDVRESIHDAIEIINDVGEKTLTVGTAVTSAGSSISGYYDGSEYINSNTYDVWRCDGTRWVLMGNIKGAKGDTGDTGATGAQGPKGDKGDKGDTGDTGPKGDKGDKGDTGDTGATGAQGPKGDTGEQGDKGDKGDKGDTGEQGEQGDKGDTGDSLTATSSHSGSATTVVIKNARTDTEVNRFNVPDGAAGNGIASITKTGTSGLVDTYTITFTDGTTTTFQITNGQDGQGAGDMTKAVYDSNESVANAGGIASYVSGAVSGKLSSSEKGAAGGVASLDSNGHVPATQLPLGETSSTVYEGNKGKANADAIAALQTGKQDALTAGDKISLSNNVINTLNTEALFAETELTSNDNLNNLTTIGTYYKKGDFILTGAPNGLASTTKYKIRVSTLYKDSTFFTQTLYDCDLTNVIATRIKDGDNAWTSWHAPMPANSSINSHSDVTISSPAADQVLQYDSSTNKWINTSMDSAPTSGSNKPVTSGGVYSALANKSNKPTITTRNIAVSDWSTLSGITFFSLEGTYPFATYDISVEPNGETITDAQMAAWLKAKPCGSSTANRIILKGTRPDVDIPVIVKAVIK